MNASLQTFSYFSTLDEPCKSCLEFLRQFLLAHSEHITESWHNHTPFYYYRKKWLCFISYHPVTKEIYISFVDGHLMRHAQLKSEGRKKMKIFRIDPSEDIDVKSLEEILAKAVSVKRKMLRE